MVRAFVISGAVVVAAIGAWAWMEWPSSTTKPGEPVITVAGVPSKPVSITPDPQDSPPKPSGRLAIPQWMDPKTTGIDVEYDKFKDETRFSLHISGVGKYSLMASDTAKGNVDRLGESETSMAIMLYPIPRRDGDLIFLADGKRYPIPSSLGLYRIAFADLLQILTAQSVEGKAAGEDPFVLSNQAKRKLWAFLSLYNR